MVYGIQKADLQLGAFSTTRFDFAPNVGVALDLSETYLGEGRILAIDDYVTSIHLADKLLQLTTSLIGTIRENSEHQPKSVVSALLRRDQIVEKVFDAIIVVTK